VNRPLEYGSPAPTLIRKHRADHSQTLFGPTETVPLGSQGTGEHLFEVTISAQPITSFAHLFPPPLGFPAQAATEPGWPGKAPRAVAPRKNQSGTAPARRFPARGIGPSRDAIPTRLFALIRAAGISSTPRRFTMRGLLKGQKRVGAGGKIPIRLIRGKFWVDRVPGLIEKAQKSCVTFCYLSALGALCGESFHSFESGQRLRLAHFGFTNLRQN